MGNPRWTWRLANGGVVIAEIDEAEGLEIVAQSFPGGRMQVLSEATRGSLPEHVVAVTQDRPGDRSVRPPIEAVLTFDPEQPICVLRVDGIEVPPSAWPTREKRVEKKDRSFAVYLGLGVAVGAAVGFGLAYRSMGASERPAGFDMTHRASNGLFVAHYPDELAPRMPALPAGVNGVVLETKDRSTAIVITSLGLDVTMGRDPWALQQRLHDELLTHIPKGAAPYQETERKEESCVGQRGAVLSGVIQDQRQAVVWSCAFVHANAGYVVMTMSSAADARRARSVIEATELTKLAPTP